MSKYRVLISGAGPAGLALGTLLDKDKFEVTIVERANEFSSIGFAIVLWKAGYEVLSKILGVKPDNIYPIDTFSMYGHPSLKKLKSTNTKGIGHSIKRADLIQQLSSAYVQRRGLQSVCFNTEIKNINNLGGRTVEVELDNGKTDKYNIVVLADGMNSKMRNKFFTTKIKKYGYKINYTWIKSKTIIKEEAIFGYIRNYNYLIQSVGDQTLLAYYNYQNVEENSKFLKKLEKSIGLEELVLDNKNMQVFDSQEIKNSKAFYKNIVLIGDSYHGLPPSGAMGTSLALEDAYTLSQKLNSDPSSNFEKAFAEYENSRHKRISKVFKVQNFVEWFLVSQSRSKIFISNIFVSLGVYSIIEHIALSIFSKPLKQESD